MHDFWCEENGFNTFWVSKWVKFHFMVMYHHFSILILSEPSASLNFFFAMLAEFLLQIQPKNGHKEFLCEF